MQIHSDIMNAFNLFVFLVIAVACAVAVDINALHDVRVEDPWGEVREKCRKECGLSRADLRRAENDMLSAKEFLFCFGLTLGNVNEDGSINQEDLLRSLSPMSPITIARPMLQCCIDRVYKGQTARDREEAATLFTEAVMCYKSLQPLSLWKVIGTYSPPTWAPLDKCHSRRWMD